MDAFDVPSQMSTLYCDTSSLTVLTAVLFNLLLGITVYFLH